MSIIPVRPLSRQAIWRMVKDIRTRLGVVDQLRFDVVGYLENELQEEYPELVVEIASMAEMGNDNGLTIVSENIIRIREDVYQGACKGYGKDRFTIAHEIGHYLLLKEQVKEIEQSEPLEDVPKYADPEWQADVFAGELLAPSYLIDGMWAVEVQYRCSVSLACAERQLRAVETEKEKALVYERLLSGDLSPFFVEIS
jgi:Zn-dependent peptidase ImmA (M78 family)